MLLHSEVLGSRQCHVGHEQTFHSWVFCRVHKCDDAVERTSVGEGVFEEIVVIIRHTHATKDNLIHLGTQSHERHHLIEGLVGVGKEWNLLTRHQRIVQVDTCNTCCNEFRGLLAAHGVHRGTANLHFLAFNLGTAIDGVSVGIEEASGQLFAHLQRGSLAKKHHFGIRRDATRAFKHLQGHVVACNLHYLSQFAVDGGKLIIAYSLRFEGDGGLRYLAYFCIYLLKSCSHNRLCGKHCLNL